MSALPAFDPKLVVDPTLLNLAKEILGGVESGQIVGLGVVIQTKDGQIKAPTWGNPLQLYLGADLMKDDIKAMLKGQSSKILRAN